MKIKGKVDQSDNNKKSANKIMEFVKKADLKKTMSMIVLIAVIAGAGAKIMTSSADIEKFELTNEKIIEMGITPEVLASQKIGNILVHQQFDFSLEYIIDTSKDYPNDTLLTHLNKYAAQMVKHGHHFSEKQQLHTKGSPKYEDISKLHGESLNKINHGSRDIEDVRNYFTSLVKLLNQKKSVQHNQVNMNQS